MEILVLSDPLLWKSVFCIALNPLLWNILAQLEYYHHTLSSLFCDRKKLAISVLGIFILLLNYIRTTSFHEALASQPQLPISHPLIFVLSVILVAIGQILVVTSFYRLGFYATFLADYFGVFIHSAPVTAFPYSICGDPMYWGSAISYLGISISHSSPAGIFLTVWVAIVYKIAISQESKMLRIIYAKKGT